MKRYDIGKTLRRLASTHERLLNKPSEVIECHNIPHALLNLSSWRLNTSQARFAYSRISSVQVSYTETTYKNRARVRFAEPAEMHNCTSTYRELGQQLSVYCRNNISLMWIECLMIPVQILQMIESQAFLGRMCISILCDLISQSCTVIASQ